MKRPPLPPILLLLTLLVAACGQKGDLYLPDEPADPDEKQERRR